MIARRRHGATTTEYALILVMVGFVMLAAVWSAGRGVRSTFDHANTAIADVVDDDGGGGGPLAAAADDGEQAAQPRGKKFGKGRGRAHAYGQQPGHAGAPQQP